MNATLSNHVRWLIRRDMDEVLDIEQSTFSPYWTEEDFLATLRRRDCIGMVTEQGEKIVGFMVHQLQRKTIRILNFAVHPKFRRQGVGAAMIAKLIGKLSPLLRTRIVLDVSEVNLPAQLFFRSQGFRAKSVLREYYQESGNDAYHMQYRLTKEVV